MDNKLKTILALFLILLTGCSQATVESSLISPADDDQPDSEWSVEPVFGGGTGKDGIPSISEPNIIAAPLVDFLEDNDLVVGVEINGVTRAYPHKLLDWHEIVNDNLGGKAITVTYCPLTGTAIGWERTINGIETTFGVSGLLHNSNLIPYDRETDSNWSQILNESVYGELNGLHADLFNVIETTWKTWKTFYPRTKVVTLEQELSGSRNYSFYPYGDYKSKEYLIFQVNNSDNRLHTKKRVLGIVENGIVKAYPIDTFTDDNQVINDFFYGEGIVIIGSASNNFAVAYKSYTQDGTPLRFTKVENDDEVMEASLYGIMEDNKGNIWNINGRAVDGPNEGELLPRTESFIGYWFSWIAFYPDLELHYTDDMDH